MPTMDFAERLTFFRELNDLSINQLSQITGITNTYLSKIERKLIPPPTWPLVKKLCLALSIDPRPMIEQSLRERLEIEDEYDLFIFDHTNSGEGLYEVVTERERRLAELEIENKKLMERLASAEKALNPPKRNAARQRRQSRELAGSRAS